MFCEVCMSPNVPRAARVFATRGLEIRYGFHALIVLILLAGTHSLFGAQVGSQSQQRIQISSSLTPATVGVAYDPVITVSGGTGPYQFQSQNLPLGLALDPSTGHITGIPQSSGPFSFSVQVFDAKGQHNTAKLKLSVANQTTVAISVAPTSVTVNSAATAQFQATVTHTCNTAVIWTISIGTGSSNDY